VNADTDRHLNACDAATVKFFEKWPIVIARLERIDHDELIV
jgi:hypothetical protein